MLRKCYLHGERSFKNQEVEHSPEIEEEDYSGKILKEIGNTLTQAAIIIEFSFHPEAFAARSYKMMTNKRPTGYV